MSARCLAWWQFGRVSGSYCAHRDRVEVRRLGHLLGRRELVTTPAIKKGHNDDDYRILGGEHLGRTERTAKPTGSRCWAA